MPKIMVIGEVLYDLFGQTGKNLVETAHFTPKMGGAAANLAVTAAKLGGDVGFIGKVGRDDFGTHLKKFMRTQGVNVTHLMMSADAPTMIGLVALPTPDTPQFILIPGATATLKEEEIPIIDIERAKLFAFGGVSLAWACVEPTFYAAQIARKAGSMVVFDVNWRPKIWPSAQAARDRFMHALTMADVVKLNLEEGEFLFAEIRPEAIAERVFELGAKLVCVSLGKDGSQFFTRAALGGHAGFRVEPVDATGAGDAFLAGICVLLSEQTRPLEALTTEELGSMAAFANGCGALVATRLGAMEAAFTRADVLALMQDNHLVA